MVSVPFQFTSGPKTAKLVLLGEAHGEQEEQHGRPFAGQSGRELFRMLGDAWGSAAARAAANLRSDHDWLKAREEWLFEQDILLTNVFAFRPAKNNLGALCAAKGDLDELASTLPAMRSENPRYLRSDFLPELRRLEQELSAHPRNLCLCLGATALWSLTGSAAISSLRGATGQGGVVATGEVRGRAVEELRALAEDDGGLAGQERAAAVSSLKLLPTYHPAAVLRAWHWRPIVLADLLKAGRERQYPELIRPKRRIIVSPSIGEVEAWARCALEGNGEVSPARLLAPDIETLNGQIRCIGFARSREDVLVIPFVARLSGGSYWGDEGDELRAWSCVRRLLESDIPKVGQNFLFDLQYLTRVGIRCRNVKHDTMLLHHTLYPEMQKGLGFLGSCYTNEQSWKLMRRHKGEEELKRDE
jgi:uracil-DNA glycosylase